MTSTSAARLSPGSVRQGDGSGDGRLPPPRWAGLREAQVCRIPSLGVGVADADRCSGHLSDSRTVSGPCWKRAKKVPLVFTREPGGPLQDWGSARSRLRLIRARSPETSRRPEACAPDGSRPGVRSRRRHLPPPPPGVCGSWRPGPEPLQGATVPFGAFGPFGPPPPPRADRSDGDLQAPCSSDRKPQVPDAALSR